MTQAAKTERKEINKNERAVYSGMVQQVTGPDIFKVVSGGTVTEYTDRLSEAQTAYRGATKPRSMYKIQRATGAVSCLGHEVL